MTEYKHNGLATYPAVILGGDCLDVMRGMETESVDAIVTDPPYGLDFMGKGWDHGVPGMPFWEAVLRVAKPGAHLLAFGGTRTHHRLMCAIEDAGWEIRDCLMWVYGSGFPKSLDVGKAIDRAAGIEREVVGQYVHPNRGPGWASNPSCSAVERSVNTYGDPGKRDRDITGPATDAAKQWDGWGTALKPAWEPIILARKPLVGTVAANVLEHGTGGLNIDECRVGKDDTRSRAIRKPGTQRYGGQNHRPHHDGDSGPTVHGSASGRWPANVVHDGSEEVVGLFPQTASGSGKRRPSKGQSVNTYGFSQSVQGPSDYEREGDSGSASRFFYTAKASRAEREAGLEGATKAVGDMRSENSGQHITRRDGGDPLPTTNHHPTVKPVALMRWLCRLVTPPDGLILDQFCGSGSTGVAASLEGFRFVGIDIDAEYCEIARKRITNANEQTNLFTGASGTAVV